MRVEIFKGDTSQLLPIALHWKAESQGKTFGLLIEDQAHIDDLQSLIVRPDADLFVLMNDNGEIVGYMGITSYKSPLSSQRIANEHYWYVLPEYRRASIRLIKAAIEWTKTRGCSHLQMSASNFASELHDRVCGLYEAFKMKKFETAYIMEM